MTLNLASPLDMSPGDIFGQAYEYLLEQFASSAGKKAGEFFTPREVV
jgi:type I restriction enzyme M protein